MKTQDQSPTHCLAKAVFMGEQMDQKQAREAPELTPFYGPLGNPVQHNAGGRYESSAMFERIALGPRPLGPKNRESLPEIAVVTGL